MWTEFTLFYFQYMVKKKYTELETKKTSKMTANNTKKTVNLFQF